MDDQPGILADFFAFRLISNEARRAEADIYKPVAGAPGGCDLLILEFDDQGLAFRGDAMDVLQSALKSLGGRQPIIVVFTHGWKHNADAGDPNLARFEQVLGAAAAQEHASAVERNGAARPVLGVYMSWRGLSRDGNVVWKNSSFWDRQQAAQRVAAGSAREALGRLRAFRNADENSGAAKATLIVIGHSFGGLIVFAAVAQSLIEAAAAPGTTIPSFCDLVLLVNPAFSAVSYLPIHAIVQRRQCDPNQLPVFVSVTAENDLATGLAFPLGNCGRVLSEATRGPEERSALIRTMGHLDWMRTHALSLDAGTAPPPTAHALAARTGRAERARMRALSQPSASDIFGGVRVTSLPGRPASPFWVASATKDVIDGHNGIFMPPFLAFVRALVGAHILAGV